MPSETQPDMPNKRTNYTLYEDTNGDHNIYFGDALDVLNDIPDESIDLIFADPPYPLWLKEPLPLSTC